MPDDEAQPFHVHQADDAYHVYQGSDIARDGGRIIMKCHDEASAEHYAALLNAAYKSGYKAGYRAARRTDRGAD